MYQVTFSEQSMRELNKLDKLAQLAAIEPISRLTPEDLAHPREPLGRFSRGGRKTFYRLRAGDFRFYFEVRSDTLHTHYILHKNSLEDLPLPHETARVGAAVVRAALEILEVPGEPDHERSEPPARLRLLSPP